MLEISYYYRRHGRIQYRARMREIVEIIPGRNNLNQRPPQHFDGLTTKLSKRHEAQPVQQVCG
uniref:Uncharacterized protein n=1 Tax=Hyaloperonospora arabidopsidis (strain Emoy2) TaxID=559515 RepID=M4BYQ7_HYAAE